MQASRLKRSRRYSARPFVTTVLLITLCAIYAVVFQKVSVFRAQSQSPSHGPRFEARSKDKPSTECRAVHQAADQCAFILANCEDDEAGLLHYLTFYYCALGNAKPVAFVILTGWLGLLFTTIGIAASDFFSVNLSTIAKLLNMSESFAGVTFLAFGNGSPDVFSTFAAMKSNSGSMAIGELVGAAGFITAVVAGSMALVREFKVSKRTFVRDVVFFIFAIIFTVFFLADGELHLWECFCMIGYYLFYVLVVVGWHMYTSRRRRQRQREVLSRTHLQDSLGPGHEELEPYRDIPDDGNEPLIGARSRSAPEPADIAVLERGPRIEIDGRGADLESPDDDDEERRDLHVAAEVTSSMRVNRPRWGRSNTTITPIRPSLVGALEFRSILSSMHKQKNMPLGPLPDRMYSDHANQLSGALERSVAPTQDARGRPRTNTSPAHVLPITRERALSHGNTPLNLGGPPMPLPETIPEPPSPGLARTASSTVDGKLAPPGSAISKVEHAAGGALAPERLQLQIPTLSRRSSGRSSPSLSPFPGFTESPGLLTPLPPNEGESTFIFPVPSERRLSPVRAPDEYSEHAKPVSWWPYRFLPPPHVLLRTIFPTLQGWKEKRWWDKVISLASTPSIFLLVTTLPVVESDPVGDEEQSDPADQPADTTDLASLQDRIAERPEAEWQEFRRRTRSASKSPRALSPHFRSLDSHGAVQEESSMQPDHRPSISFPVPHLAKPLSQEPDHVTATSADEDQGWSRWLVAVQIFTGPLFVVFITWANLADDMENPRQAILQMMMYGLILSCGMLAALLLLTTADKKPKYHFLLCFLGFVISIAWISTIAGEVVGVLKAIGVILGISEAILGLTIFAVGNSLGDLVADITVARLGFPVMAL